MILGLYSYRLGYSRLIMYCYVMLLYIYNMLLDAFPLDKDRSRFVSWLVERFVLKFADSSELVPLLRIEEESRTDEREIAVDTSLRIDLFRAQ